MLHTGRIQMNIEIHGKRHVKFIPVKNNLDYSSTSGAKIMDVRWIEGRIQATPHRKNSNKLSIAP
jgi:hypothetical protein